MQHVNPYDIPAPPQPWWKTTRAVLGMLALVLLLSVLNLALGFLAALAVVALVWSQLPWRQFAKVGSTAAALMLMTIGAGLGGHLDDDGTNAASAKPQAASSPRAKATASQTHAEPVKAADYTSRPLDDAEEGARAAGLTPSHHDAGQAARSIVLLSDWTVCFQKVDTAVRSIDFAAVKAGEPCPAEDGGPLPWPQMPDVVGDTYNAAVEELQQSGIDLGTVTLDDVYLDIKAPTAKSAAADGDEWRVCFQSPGRGGTVTADTRVHLDLGRWTDGDTVRRCPAAKNTTYKHPADRPARHHDTGSSSGGSTSSGGSGGSTSSSSSGGGGSVGVVHPGSFCSPPGALGVTSKGTPMICGPASDGRNRWHSR